MKSDIWCLGLVREGFGLWRFSNAGTKEQKFLVNFGGITQMGGEVPEQARAARVEGALSIPNLVLLGCFRVMVKFS